jgi:hypothetical protein
MNNSELLAFVQAEIQRMEALDGPCARFVRSQLERTAQLLRLTAADSPEEFDERVECNEEWVKENEYECGYTEGRSHGLAEAKAVINAVYGHPDR